MFVLLFSFFSWAHDAAFEVEDSIYVFHAGMHVQYEKGASMSVEGYPKELSDQSFPGLGLYRTRIVAALNQDPHTVVFFLSDGKTIVYNAMKKQVVQKETLLSDQNWKGLAPYGSLIQAAFRMNQYHAYFFLRNGLVIRYDYESNQVEKDFPKPLSETIWNTISPEWGPVQQVFSWNEQSIYLFFATKQYVRFNRSLYSVDEGYPKPLDERKWPGMGAWLGTDFQVVQSQWDRQKLLEGEQITLQLPYQYDHSQGTAIISRRYLLADLELEAASEYPDQRSVFEVVPVPLENIEAQPFVQYILLKNSKGYIHRKQEQLVSGGTQDEAEIFQLDMRWGAYVVLSKSKKHRQWKKRKHVSKKESWQPISFALRKDHHTAAQAVDEMNGGALLILKKVVPNPKEP